MRRLGRIALPPCPREKLKDLCDPERNSIELAYGTSDAAGYGKLGVPLRLLPPGGEFVGDQQTA